MSLEIEDSVLRDRLIALGYTPGPITATTKSIYIKKLQKLEGTDKPKKSSRAVSRTTATVPEPRILSPVKTRTTVENATPLTVVKTEPAQADISPEIPGLPIRPRPSHVAAHTVIDSNHSCADSDFRPRTFNGLPRRDRELERTPQRLAGHTPRRSRGSTNYYVASDSDDYDSDHLEPPSSKRDRPTGQRSYNWLPTWWTTDAQSRPTERVLTRSDVSDFSDNEASHALREAGINTSSHLLLPSNRSANLTQDLDVSRRSSWLRSSPTATRRLRENSLFQRPNLQEVPASSSWLTSLPNAMVAGLLVVLVLSSVTYWKFTDTTSSFIRMNNLNRLVCSDLVPASYHNTIDSHNCIRLKQKEPALQVVAKLYDLLSRLAGEFHCGEALGAKDARVTVQSARMTLEEHGKSAIESDVWRAALFLIVRLGGRQFHVAAFDSQGQPLDDEASVDAVASLESLRPYFPGWCRLWLLGCLVAQWSLFLLRVSLAGASLAAAGYLVYRAALWRRAQFVQRQRRISELIGHIMGMLQRQMSDSEEDPSGRCAIFKPVRQILHELRAHYNVGCPSKLSVDSLWPAIVAQVHNQESAIGVQDIMGLGEVWSWQGGSGWQGSAIASHSPTNKAPFSTPPAECLKIRNMFTEEILEGRKEARVKRELLRKIAHCGEIYHIGINAAGDRSAVYVRCANAHVAGRVFMTINAHYFDGQLVTARFLKLDKYLLRFPESQNCQRPIGPMDISA